MVNIVQFLSPSLGVENYLKSQLLTLKDKQTQTKHILFSRMHTETFPDLFFVFCRITLIPRGCQESLEYLI